MVFRVGSGMGTIRNKKLGRKGKEYPCPPKDGEIALWPSRTEQLSTF